MNARTAKHTSNTSAAWYPFLIRWLCFAPRFWETYGETAFPIDTKINEKTFSTLIVAEYPARACVPKGFTTACTIIMPMDTVDCCKTDGTAIRSIEVSSCLSNQLKLLSYLRIR